MKICKVQNCGKKSRAKEMCSTHYDRERRGEKIMTGREEFMINNKPVGGRINVYLSGGGVSSVDFLNYQDVSKHEWSLMVTASGNRYAYRRFKKPDGKIKYIFLHHAILGLDRMVDHIDGDGLNNIRSNLRFCNVRQNSQNMKKRERTSSIYKGVSRSKRTGKWVASINPNRKCFYLYEGHSEHDAAIYYDVAAQLFYGSFAKLNFPQPSHA